MLYWNIPFFNALKLQIAFMTHLWFSIIVSINTRRGMFPRNKEEVESLEEKEFLETQFGVIKS